MQGAYLFLVVLIVSLPVYADFWGGDIPLLTSIVANTSTQIARLNEIMETGEKSLKVLDEVNEGVHRVRRLTEIPSRARYGLFSRIQGIEHMGDTLKGVYGGSPLAPLYRANAFAERSVSESLMIHKEVTELAYDLDKTANDLIRQSNGASPAGASKLAAQGAGIQVRQNNEVLRTNSSMLKIQAQQLALKNAREREERVQSQRALLDASRAVRSSGTEFHLSGIGHR